MQNKWSAIIKEGSIVTIEGVYKRRTLWEFLKRQPKELRKFKVLSSYTEQNNAN